MIDTLPLHATSAILIVTYASYKKVMYGTHRACTSNIISANVDAFRVLLALFLVWVFVLLPSQFHVSEYFGFENPIPAFIYVLLPLPVVVGIWEYAKTPFFIIASGIYYFYLFWFTII